MHFFHHSSRPNLVNIVIIILLCASGCNSKPGEQSAIPAAVQIKTSHLFTEPLDPAVVESALDALPIWRKATGSSPILVLLSNDPLLRSVPDSAKEQAIKLATSGSPDEILERGARPAPDPVFFEDMSLDLSLKSGFFSKVVWLLPLTKSLPLEAFRDQLIKAGAITQSEGDSFSPDDDQCFSGKVRNVPVQVCTIDHLPKLHSPVVLHWEMSYFREIYQDEVRTPLYNTLGDIANKLRQADWRVASMTINRNSLSQETTLATRFLADDLASLAKNPTLLTNPNLPAEWNLRQKAFYVDLLFQRSKSIEKAQELVKLLPNDASTHYLLYHFLVKDSFKDASEHLHTAVRLDPIYALEYLDLADWALKKGQYEAALDLIGRAQKAFPKDPFIKLQHANVLLLAGRNAEALPLIKELHSLTWSPLYYAHIPLQLEQMSQQAGKPSPR